ncbi:flagellar hook-length control protein FliK [Clostridium nigeriense]|uniref:flagellar hook-length control protein FliK n=1 Tax=Clostridium nigeriense TaxID=1805470 RepID=UPI00082EBE36|nr:flagellar hook-length control protein FliK [Clostridium nigeriense]
MVDTAVVINLSSKVQSLKSNNKSEDLKVENKNDFKDFLSKEVNLNNEDSINNSSKNIKNNTKTNIDEKGSEENQITTEELTSEILGKIEEVLNNEDLKINSDDEALEEILFLLLNLIEVNLKDSSENNTNNLNEINTNNIEVSENILSKLFKEDENSILNFNKDISLNKENEVLKNINGLIEKYLNKSKENEFLSPSNSLNEINKELLNEIKNLISIMPDSSIKEIEGKLKTDVSKEILNTLILNTNKELETISDISKDSTQKNDINKDNVANVEGSTKKSESKINLKENTNEENLNEGKTSKDNNIDKKEEKILMKFLDEDSSQSFSKTLNYYDKLNKINATVEVIKEPIAINKESINLDIIKNVKYMVRNAVEELKVKIYPKELGEMTIKILSEEGIMKAEIKATSKETYNLLNSNLNEIKKTLENQNIRIQEVNIGIYNEDTTFFSGKENSRDNLKEFNNKKEGNSIYEEDESLEDLVIDNNVNFLA